MTGKLYITLSLIGLVVLANSMVIKKRGFSEDIEEFISQTNEFSKKMTELAKLNAKLSFQNSIASLNFTQNQILEDIHKIETNEFTKPTMFHFKGNPIFFDGKKFSDSFFGNQLNETESKEAFSVLKEKLINTLNTVKNTGQNLENSLNQLA